MRDGPLPCRTRLHIRLTLDQVARRAQSLALVNPRRMHVALMTSARELLCWLRMQAQGAGSVQALAAECITRQGAPALLGLSRLLRSTGRAPWSLRTHALQI